jgi:hypothetical protein
MKTIWNYPLEVTDLQTLKIPQGAQILSAQIQSGQLMLWALVDTSNPCEKVKIEVVGTGNPIADACRKYISTVQMGPFVWHVFQLVA